MTRILKYGVYDDFTKVTTCGHCRCVFEYGEFDISEKRLTPTDKRTPTVICPQCGRTISVKEI